MPDPTPHSTPLRELAGLFLRLGTTAFGGPAAHIAMMEEEVVRKRKWLTQAEFLDLIAATNLIPGPNSTEMAIHIGYTRGGWKGLIVAGTCFIVPAMLIVGLLAHWYTLYGTVPPARWLLYGMKPVIVAVIAQAIWQLGKGAITTPRMAALLLGSLFLAGAGVHELVILFGAGIVALLARLLRRGTQGFRTAGLTPLLPLLPVAPAAGAAAAAATGAAPFSVSALFGFFVKTGAVLYGSGYVLIAFIESALVDRYGWLTRPELLDAVAAGQVTPGPLFTTATFIGYLLGEKWGTGGILTSLAATAGIFLPAFLFVGITAPFLPRMRQSQLLAALLDGFVAASLALMAAVLVALTRDAVTDPYTGAVSILAALLLVRFKAGSTWLLAAGALGGWIVHSL